MNILKSEKIKLKHSGVLSISMFTPFICAIFSILFGGSYNAIYQTVYWWTGIFLYLLFQLLVFKNLALEEKANHYFNIESLNLNRFKVYLSKEICTIYYGVLATLWMTGLIFLIRWATPANHLFKDSIQMVAGLGLILINCLWIIPTFILVRNRLNGLLWMLVNFVISLLVAPFVAGSPFFFLLPHAYPYKTAKCFFYLKEAGDLLGRSITSMDRLECLLASVLSLGLFLSLNLLLYRSEQK